MKRRVYGGRWWRGEEEKYVFCYVLFYTNLTFGSNRFFFYCKNKIKYCSLSFVPYICATIEENFHLIFIR